MDKFDLIKGYFKIEYLDKDGNVLEYYEDNNKIMVPSKLTMRDAMYRNMDPYSKPIGINCLILGTEGHSPDNILLPKDFPNNLTDIYSVTNNTKHYPIVFDKQTIVDEGFSPTLPNSRNSDTNLEINTIKEGENYIIEYRFVIPQDNANDGGNPIIYTEAGLYSSLNQKIQDLGVNPGDPLTVYSYGTLFSMKTFPGNQTKDDTSEIKLTWRIIF